MNTLTHEQQSVLYHLLHGENVFLTGGGGVGKSYLLTTLYREFPAFQMEWERKRHPDGIRAILRSKRIHMCALTGCAALLLGQKTTTLHRWSGIGLGKGTVAELLTKIRRNRKAMSHWLSTDLLVIDEVSMLTAELFDKLNELGKKIRGNRRPFGGIQLLIVGDFYQLPPVTKGQEEMRFAFEAEGWRECVTRTVELTIIQRQKEEAFQTILGEARIGVLSAASAAILRSYEGKEWQSNKIRPTLLFPRRADVDLINQTNLRALTGRRYTYSARLLTEGKVPRGFSMEDEAFVKAVEHMDTDAAYSREMELMMDAQVMLIANTAPDIGLVNGSRGVVVGFCPSTDFPIVEFLNGMRVTVGPHSWPVEDYPFISRSQIPLQLAWAYTIHKCQGSTVDSALVDIGAGIFEYGQAYVALSRMRSLDALYVYDFSPSAFRAHPRVKEFYERLRPTVMDVETLDAEFRGALMPACAIVFQGDAEDVKEPGMEEKEAVVAANDVHAANEPEEPEEPNEPEEPKEPEEPNHADWLYASVPDAWKAALVPHRDILQTLSTQLAADTDWLPSADTIWAALERTPPESVRVVILGQDPYPTPGHAHGLAFSVQPQVHPLPPSLKNIYKELAASMDGWVAPHHGCLDAWARRGVLLLNTVLTVKPGAPASHNKLGWETITDALLQHVAAAHPGVVFVLWGKAAQAKKKLLGGHRIMECAHPSPLSAHKGFLGSGTFRVVNEWLVEAGMPPMDWSLAE